MTRFASDLMRAAHLPEGKLKNLLLKQGQEKLNAATQAPEPGRAGSGSHFLRAHYQKPSK